MGHYDECRPGYCPSCGAGPGNLASNGGVCPFCHPSKRGPRSLRERLTPKAAWPLTTTIDIPELADYGGTLGDLRKKLNMLIKRYGTDAVLRTDAGHNNVQFTLTIPKEK
jgi:hypothetical protein